MSAHILSRPRGRINAGSLLRKSIKTAALPLGAAQRARPGDIVILLYHRVGIGDREIDLPAVNFERHMAYLREHARPRTLDQALNGDGSGGVVVTVDDGYRDFQEHVLPILERHRVPALLFLATGLVDPDGRRADRLTWADLRDAVGTGLVTVGSHTHNHVDLSKADGRSAEREMRGSKELIEDQLGVACQHFAYPWSVASQQAEGVARRLFRTASLRWATNRRGQFDTYRMGRTPVLRGDGQTFFKAKVAGMLDGEALAYRVLRRGPWRAS